MFFQNNKLLILLSVFSLLFLNGCGDDSSSPNNANPAQGNILPEVSSSGKNEDTPVYSVITGTMVDERDGQIYKTVTIGSQTWMAQNLNYQTANSFCYNDNVANCTKYGRLYTWNAADSACPTGWFLPTKFQWEALINAIGGSSTAGTELKSTSGWRNDVVLLESDLGTRVNVDNGTDAISFSALPAGIRETTSEISDGYYDSEGMRAGFWSSTEAGVKPLPPFGTLSLYWCLRLSGSQTYFKDASLHNGYSVRCIKD